MEKHRCKLCFRKFANGRALGGHMRSHMMNLPIPPKPKPPPIIPSCEAPSSSTSSDSNPQTPDDCFHPRLADHDYSSSLISSLQDRESENESFKNNKTTTIAATATARRRRSKRIVTHKPSSFSSTYCSDYLHEKQKCRRVGDDNDDDDDNVNYDMVERVSCTSEVTSDEDLAFCLMMMSRDSWSSSNNLTKHDDDDDDDDDDDGNHDHDDDGDNMVDDDSSSRVMKKKYKCETCDKVFRSYQALGGHRASHKKQRLMTDNNNNNNNNNNNEVNQSYCNIDEKIIMEEDEFMLVQKKVHECPVCYRVFSSGQALGGHKRSHVLATTTTVNNNNNSIINGVEKTSSSSPAKKKKKKMMMMVISTSSCHNNGSFIDLNLPAPIEDDDDEEISDDQIAVSAVSDNVHFC